MRVLLACTSCFGNYLFCPDNYRLLILFSYLETGGEDATIRPWVWISWLFLGPVIGSLVFERYNYMAVSDPRTSWLRRTNRASRIVVRNRAAGSNNSPARI